MVKAVREANICDASPEFIRVFYPQVFSQRLKIPRDILKNLKGVLASDCIIETNGREWRVTLEKVGKSFFFGKGWPEFVQDNAIDYPDFLVFSYVDNLKFQVSIWDRHGGRKGAGLQTTLLPDATSKALQTEAIPDTAAMQTAEIPDTTSEAVHTITIPDSSANNREHVQKQAVEQM